MSSVTVDLNSVDAMFAKVLAEQLALKEALNLRMTAQDTVLVRIEAQTTKTNGRVTVLEGLWRDQKIRLAAYASVAGTVGSAAVWLAHKIYA